MKLSLNFQILLGSLIGVTVGLLLNISGDTASFYGPIFYACELGGKIFVDLLKMILIPLVFTSITVGIANLRAHAQMNKVWKTALMYFISTTALSVFLGLIVVNIFKPGVGLEITLFQDAMSTFSTKGMTLPEFFKTFISGLFVNPVYAMANTKVLPTVIFALFLGIALVMSGDKAKASLKLLNECFELIMVMVNWIMKLAPVGIAALLAKLIATQDATLFAALGKFILVVIGALLFHGFVVLPCLLMTVAKVSPLKFFKGIREALVTAFSTSSSSATLPITMNCVEKNLKVDKDVAGFVLPLGATINMDGTALYEAVAALFVANIMGIELNIIQQLIIFFTSIIAAIGAPGIPSAGMVTMVMVLQSVGLPVEAIAILLPIDRFLDAVRTTVNVEGDAIGSMVVNRIVNNKA
ncbi:Proton/glutamate symporter @ Sodium/glutamate symporter [hydrothermal vent metagenome]|uniref:Proton/glutamate symporter @ Sodium/glutamate symporter n=1 Tax=hydrothermal vent metagenome TaxID=652676 RepID=A0A3B1DHR9_9ZZZZ